MLVKVFGVYGVEMNEALRIECIERSEQNVASCKIFTLEGGLTRYTEKDINPVTIKVGNDTAYFYGAGQGYKFDFPDDGYCVEHGGVE